MNKNRNTILSKKKMAAWKLCLLTALLLTGARDVIGQNCNADFDLVFVVDSSGSIRNSNVNGVDNYNLMIQFMLRFVDLVNVASSPNFGVQIGIVLFGNRGEIELNLTGNENEIRSTLNSLRYLDQNTNTSGGLLAAKQVLQGGHNRPFVNDVILTLTDGNPSLDVDLTEANARQLQQSSLMFAVGVTQAVNRENITILSSPDSAGQVREGRNYWLLPDFGALATTVDSIADVICATVVQGQLCSSNPCQNGATCLDDLTRYVCQCRQGYYGTNCELHYCTPSPCLNGGTCDAGTNGYNCSCRLGYYGTNCENAYCTTGVCRNGGTCVPGSTGYTCTCRLGYYGNNCENAYCSAGTCLNGGTCVAGLNSFTCQCRVGFYGTNCELAYCAPNPCQNDGVCQASEFGYVCDCRIGFYATHCENDYCDHSYCRNGAQCSWRIDGFDCVCLAGYYGDYCEADYCSPNPCYYNGTCVRLVDGYSCNCQFGYVGDRCQSDVCNPNPCLNGGACVRQRASYTCNCLPGYVGLRCISLDRDEPTTEDPTPAAAASSNNNSDSNAYVIGLVILIILLVLALLILILLCCCWNKFLAVCCKRKEKYVAPITPFHTKQEKVVVTEAKSTPAAVVTVIRRTSRSQSGDHGEEQEKVVGTETKSTQAAVVTANPVPLKKKKKTMEVVTVETCPYCGNVKDHCVCCPICFQPNCCGHHCAPHHHHVENTRNHYHHDTCGTCNIVNTCNHGTMHNSCPGCNYGNVATMKTTCCPQCQGGNTSCSCSIHGGSEYQVCENFASAPSRPTVMPMVHPATLTYQNSTSKTPRRPTRMARRARAMERRSNSQSRDEHVTSGMTSDTASCSSRILLLDADNRPRRGKNESSTDTERSEARTYVYVPTECPSVSESRMSASLRASFERSRVGAGK